MVASLNSQITVSNSTFKTNSAISGGAIFLGLGSGLAAFDCLFDENRAEEKGNTLFKVETGNVSLENCTLRNTNAIGGGPMFFMDSNYLRLSRGLCQYEKAEEATCVEFECRSEDYQCTFFTLNYTITNGLHTINSGHDDNFFHNGTKYGMIKSDMWSPWRETPFASRM